MLGMVCDASRGGGKDRFGGSGVGGVMRKVIGALALAIAVGWSSSAYAVLKDTTVTVTDKGQPIPNATIKIARSDRKPAPRPKTRKKIGRAHV